jgi:hypothetical protein
MSDIKIRLLKVKDRIVLAEMVKKLADKLGDNNLLNFIAPNESTTKSDKVDKTGNAGFAIIGLRVLKMLLETLSEDMRKWFASLIDKTPEEFDELPFDTEIKILEQLTYSREANDFFTGALRLYKKMQGYADQSLDKKK